MKCLSCLLFFVTSLSLHSQSNTEVYLFDLNAAGTDFQISNMLNISNDLGYDSQPSFASNNILLFAGNNNGQTDIALYQIDNKKKTWFNNETSGGEYSPQQFPATTDVTAVRLDTTGLQRLYRYNSANGNSTATELIVGLQVAYYAFYDEQIGLATVLSNERLDLVRMDLVLNKADTLFLNAGRSIHKVPNSDSMSYTLTNEAGNQDIYLMDMTTSESFFVTEMPKGIQDYSWLGDSKLVLGSIDKLFIYDLGGNGDWILAADLSNYQINGITRIAVSPDMSKLALVATPN